MSCQICNVLYVIILQPETFNFCKNRKSGDRLLATLQQTSKYEKQSRVICEALFSRLAVYSFGSLPKVVYNCLPHNLERGVLLSCPLYFENQHIQPMQMSIKPKSMCFGFILRALSDFLSCHFQKDRQIFQFFGLSNFLS